MGLLSLAIWLPIAAGVLLLAIGRDEHAGNVRWIALIVSILSFLVTLPLISGFDTGTAAMQFQENLPWIERLNVHYRLGVDGLSVWFVLLTAFITVIVVISAWKVITDRVNQYMGAFLILSGLMVGVFAALDALLFYVFFEATLIPMYLIIGVWGGPRRVYAAFKFFLYTLAGSLLMLVALVYLYYKSGGSFDILAWHRLPLSETAQTLLFFAFFAAFAMLFFMANCGLPGTSGFTGEWMVILATVKVNFWLGLLAATALITGAAYSLWMYKRVYFGKATHESVRGLADIDARETLMLALLVAPVLVMGLYPKPFTDVMQVSVTELLRHVAVSKL
jgi:NADH:ubiquinone oxidoreductase subunit 4 (subunit M)